MKVLLLGITGNVGSRLLPALLAHNHQVVAYVRTPSKISPEATSKLDSVVVGSANDSAAIKAAILTHSCDAVVNAAGIGNVLSAAPDFEAIFAAVVKACVEAGKERGSKPIRCWMMSGFGMMDHPANKGHVMLDYFPLFPAHRPNYQLIKSQPTDALAWSLFCASNMTPEYDTQRFPPPADVSSEHLVAKAEVPPAWNERKLRWVPALGNYLNVLVQSQSYFAGLEKCADFMAADLERGLESEWVGKRVGVKEKSKCK